LRFNFHVLDPLPELNLEAIPDATTRQAVVVLLNLLEQHHAEVRALREENQRLRDEIARLKGEQGRPKVNPKRESDPPAEGAPDHSSEAERRQK